MKLPRPVLFVGLATDTGFFRFDSTTPRAHEIAAELLRMGVRPARAYQELYERNTVAFTRLLGHALSGLNVDEGGCVAWVTIRRELIESLDADEVETSEIATALLAMGGVLVVLLFRELPDGRVLSVYHVGNHWPYPPPQDEWIHATSFRVRR